MISDGVTWSKVEGSPALDSHAELQRLALARAGWGEAGA